MKQQEIINNLHLHQLNDISKFMKHVKAWMKTKVSQQ